MDSGQQFDNGAASKKKPRKAGFMRKITEGDQRTKAATFKKRLPTVKNKAFQLQTLCDVSVCVASAGAADGKVTILWPEDPDQIRDAIGAYRSVDGKQRHEMTVLGYLEKRKRKARQLSAWIDGLSSNPDALAKAAGLLESKIAELEGKTRETGLAMEGNMEENTLTETENDEINEVEIGCIQSSSLEQVREAGNSQSFASADYSLGPHLQPVGLAWNNGGLVDHVQSNSDVSPLHEMLPLHVWAPQYF